MLSNNTLIKWFGKWDDLTTVRDVEEGKRAEYVFLKALETRNERGKEMESLQNWKDVQVEMEKEGLSGSMLISDYITAWLEVRTDSHFQQLSNELNSRFQHLSTELNLLSDEYVTHKGEFGNLVAQLEVLRNQVEEMKQKLNDVVNSKTSGGILGRWR